MQRTTIDWNKGAVLFGFGTRWTIDDPGIQGWEESTPIQKLSDSRADSYGDRDTPLRGKGRTVTVGGFVTAGTDRDQLVTAFRQALTLSADPREKRELTITTAGRTLTAFGQVAARKIVQGKYWGIGRFGWAVQWVCDDMLRYAPEQTASAPLVAVGGGITPPLTPPLTLPFRAKSGTVFVANDGERLTPMTVELAGPQLAPVGVTNSTTGRTLSYPIALAASDTLVIDTRKGWAVLNGDATRSPSPGSAVTRSLGLDPGLNTIRALGRPGVGGSPLMTVRWRPAYE